MLRAALIFFILLLLGPSSFAGSTAPPDVAYREYRQYKIRDRADHEVQCKVTVEVICLTEQATREQRFVIGEEAGERIDDLSARINGKKIDGDYIDKVHPDLRDAFFMDLTLWVIRFPKFIQVGDTLSYEYEVTYNSAADIDLIRLQNIDYIETLDLLFEHDKDVTIDVEWFFPGDSVPMVVERPEDDELRIRVDSVRRRSLIPMRDYDDLQALGLITIRNGDSLFTPTAPEAYAAWYLAQLTYPMALDSTAAPELAAEIDRAESDAVAIEAIHDFVRGSIRYVSDLAPPHAILPHPPNKVLANRYGDCKDRAFLVQALAERHGLKVYPAVVSKSHTREFDGVHTGLFNHVVCVVETDRGPLFFDPTPGYYPIGTLPPEMIGCYALILNPENVRVEEVWPQDTLPDYELALSGHIDSLASGRATLTLRTGYRAEVLNARSELTNYEFQRFLAARLPKYLTRIALEGFELGETGKQSLTVSCRADLTSFLVRSPSGIYIPKNPFIAVAPSSLERADDRWPMQTGIPRQYRVHLDLRAPGCRAEADSLHLSAPGLAGMSSHLVADDSGRFSVDYWFQLQAVRVAGARKDDFLAFCRANLDSKRDMYKLAMGGKP